MILDIMGITFSIAIASIPFICFIGWVHGELMFSKKLLEDL